MLIVDASAVVRKVLSEELSKARDIEAVVPLNRVADTLLSFAAARTPSAAG